MWVNKGKDEVLRRGASPLGHSQARPALVEETSTRFLAQTHSEHEMSTPATLTIPIKEKIIREEITPESNQKNQEQFETEGVAENQEKEEAECSQERKSQEHKQLKQQTTKQIRRIGWSKKQGIAAIKQRYGVSERTKMSIEQLIDFRDYLKAFPNK